MAGLIGRLGPLIEDAELLAGRLVAGLREDPDGYDRKLLELAWLVGDETYLAETVRQGRATPRHRGAARR